MVNRRFEKFYFFFCTGELLVIVEYCPFGNLHDYLLTHRKQFIDQRDKKTGTIDFSIGQAVTSDECVSCLSVERYNRCLHIYTLNLPLIDQLINCNFHSNEETKNLNISRNESLCTQDLISWAFQVARGMEYLSQKNVGSRIIDFKNIDLQLFISIIMVNRFYTATWQLEIFYSLTITLLKFATLDWRK